MKIGNLQIETFKALVTGDKAVRYCVDGERVLLTMDGYSAFAVPEKSLCIDLKKMSPFEAIKPHFTLTENDVPVKITNVFMSGNGGTLVRMKSDTFDLWIKKAFYEKYGKDSLAAYCAGPREPVKFTGISSDVVDAIVLPVYVSEGWLDR